jgi:hypothetical protein
MFVNHSLQVVTRVPRLSVMNCFLVLSGTSKDSRPNHLSQDF